MNIQNAKKSAQLGMNVSTAGGRLTKDLLFQFVVNSGAKCHRCGGELTRDTFSVDHIIPWLHTDEPVKSFFDLSNIAYSHLSCNCGEARHPNKQYESVKEQKVNAEKRRRGRRVYNKEYRLKYYQENGK